MTGFPLEQLGPAYPALSGAARFRRIAAARPLTAAETRAYGEVVLSGIRALQRSEITRATPERRPNCVSGTAYTDGADILAAIRRSNLAALANCSRIERTAEEWRKAYDEAMAAKRAAEAEATRRVKRSARSAPTVSQAPPQATARQLPARRAMVHTQFWFGPDSLGIDYHLG